MVEWVFRGSLRKVGSGIITNWPQISHWNPTTPPPSEEENNFAAAAQREKEREKNSLTPPGWVYGAGPILSRL